MSYVMDPKSQQMKFQFSSKEEALRWAGNILYEDMRTYLKYHPHKATTTEEAQSEDDIARALCIWDGVWTSSPFEEGENGVTYDIKTGEVRFVAPITDITK